MYVIKMDKDKSLVTTVHSTIYRGEMNADTLVFIIPQMYNNENIANCSLLLRYILPDGSGRSEELEMYPLPYNKDYYQFRLKTSTRFTQKVGEITLWLTVINLRDDIVLKTGEAVVEITPSKNIIDYLPPEGLDQLDGLFSKVDLLERGKADNIARDSETKTLQLLSNGIPIGDPMDMRDMLNDDYIIDFGGDDSINIDQPPPENASANTSIIHF